MKRTLSVIVLLSVLCLLASPFPSGETGTASVQNPSSGAPVNIVGPLPVPVRGTVGIDGTANVNFANTRATPLFVRDVDPPARQPYQETRTVGLEGDCVANGCKVSFAPVPAGKRLVITRAAAAFFFTPGAAFPIRQILPRDHTGFPPRIEQAIPVQFQSSDSFVDSYAFNQEVLLYMEAGQAPFLEILTNRNPGTGLQRLSLAGYYVNVP